MVVGHASRPATEPEPVLSAEHLRSLSPGGKYAAKSAIMASRSGQTGRPVPCQIKCNTRLPEAGARVRILPAQP